MTKIILILMAVLVLSGCYIRERGGEGAGSTDIIRYSK